MVRRERGAAAARVGSGCRGELSRLPRGRPRTSGGGPDLLRGRARPPRTSRRFPSTAPAPCSRSAPPAGARRSAAQLARRWRRLATSSLARSEDLGTARRGRARPHRRPGARRRESSLRSSAASPSSSPPAEATRRSPPRSSSAPGRSRATSLASTASSVFALAWSSRANLRSSPVFCGSVRRLASKHYRRAGSDDPERRRTA